VDADRDRRVRAAAATSLGWIGDRRALDSLRIALLSGDWTICAAAADALALLGDRRPQTEGGLAVAVA
jgi:HEAT repeat protein